MAFWNLSWIYCTFKKDDFYLLNFNFQLNLGFASCGHFIYYSGLHYCLSFSLIIWQLFKGQSLVDIIWVVVYYNMWHVDYNDNYWLITLYYKMLVITNMHRRWQRKPSMYGMLIKLWQLLTVDANYWQVCRHANIGLVWKNFFLIKAQLVSLVFKTLN